MHSEQDGKDVFDAEMAEFLARRVCAIADAKQRKEDKERAERLQRQQKSERQREAFHKREDARLYQRYVEYREGIEEEEEMQIALQLAEMNMTPEEALQRMQAEMGVVAATQLPPSAEEEEQEVCSGSDDDSNDSDYILDCDSGCDSDSGSSDEEDQ